MSIYKKAKIYTITNVVDNTEFIGATTQELSTRFSKLKKTVPRNKTLLQKKMNEIPMFKFRIIYLERYPCSTKDELNARVEYWVKKHGALRDTQYLDDVDTLEEQEDEKKLLKEQPFLQSEGQKHYAQNRERLLEYQRQYMKSKQPEHCICGATVKKMKQHLESGKHQNYLNWGLKCTRSMPDGLIRTKEGLEQHMKQCQQHHPHVWTCRISKTWLKQQKQKAGNQN